MRKLLLLSILYWFIQTKTNAQAWQYHTIPGATGDLVYTDTLQNKCYLTGTYGTLSNPANIISWDGHQFETLPLCPIPSYYLPAITSYHGKLYAGGYIGLAVLNGNSWQWVDSNAIISKLYVHDDKLYVAGGFTQIAQQPIGKIAVWNDTTWQSAWGADTFFTNAGIYDMAFYQNQFYVCGEFESPDGSIQDLARFDGQHWTGVGPAPLYAVPQRLLLSMHVWKDTLYIGGRISESPIGYGGEGIVKWDGQQISPVLDGLPEAYTDHMITYKDKLLCTGLITNVNGIDVISGRGIAQWDGQQWCTIGRNDSSQFFGMGVIHDTLHVFGLFYDQSGNVMGDLATLVSDNYTDSCSNHDAPLGIKPIPQQLFSIYPNPVTDIVHISLKKQGTYTYILRNSMGMTVDKGSLVYTQEPVQVDMRHIPQGMYSITLTDTQGRKEVQKFIKR